MRTSVITSAVRGNYAQFSSSSGSGKSLADRAAVGSAALLAVLGFGLSSFSLKQMVKTGGPRKF